ncbi:hypothetical protein VTK56DRAFT_9961 [Thermocarpiscus australiensis]
MDAPSPKAPSPTEEEGDRRRLTEAEKRANHIASEQKRRAAIRGGFDRLAELVPGLEGQGRAEGLVLHGTVDYIKKLMLERRAMIEALEARGKQVDMQTKISLEALPEGWLDGGGGPDSSPTQPSKNGDG